MKPRIEKKLSKKLVEIFEGTKQFADVWIDEEYCRWPIRPEGNVPLTSAQIRQNWQARASVTNVPSIGGEADYWGEGSDYHTVYARYVLDLDASIWYADELFRLTHRWPEDPPLTVDDEARKTFLISDARRKAGQIRNGAYLLKHARVDALQTRHKEEFEKMRMDQYLARRKAEAASRASSGADLVQ